MNCEQLKIMQKIIERRIFFRNLKKSCLYRCVTPLWKHVNWCKCFMKKCHEEMGSFHEKVHEEVSINNQIFQICTDYNRLHLRPAIDCTESRMKMNWKYWTCNRLHFQLQSIAPLKRLKICLVFLIWEHAINFTITPIYCMKWNLI